MCMFLKLDLRSIYWQFPMQEQPIKKTTFRDQDTNSRVHGCALWYDWANINLPAVTHLDYVHVLSITRSDHLFILNA